MRQKAVRHEFVHFIPNEREMLDQTLYISTVFATAVHKCACGCGNKVVTPLSPTDWKLTFDGRTVSLHPSIGNWSSPCRSHYWIKENRIHWDVQWTQAEIQAARERQRSAKEGSFRPQLDARPPAFFAKLQTWWRKWLAR